MDELRKQACELVCARTETAPVVARQLLAVASDERVKAIIDGKATPTGVADAWRALRKSIEDMKASVDEAIEETKSGE